MRVFSDAASASSASLSDVAIFAFIPNELTHVAGIISEQPQTALSHINIKAKQNGTPNSYLKDASTRFADLIGKPVYMRVFPAKEGDFDTPVEQGLELREASQEEVDASVSVCHFRVCYFHVSIPG